MKLSRRRFLTAGSATLLLPMLESDSRGSESDSQFIFFCRQANGVTQGYQVNGEPNRFWPSQTGQITQQSLNAEPDKVLSELAPWADKMIIPKGIDFPHFYASCGHSGGGIQCLTAAKISPDLSANEARAMNESVDNYIARHFQHMGGEPLTLYTGIRNGHLEEVLSYRGPKQLRPAEDNPWVAYQRMLGVSDSSYSELVFERRQSINDLIMDDIRELQQNRYFSAADKRKLELHFDSIREFEVLAANLPAYQEREMLNISGMEPSDELRMTIAKMHMDLIALAFSANYAKAATLQIGDGADGTRYTINGVTHPSFHWISHRNYSDENDGEIIVGAEDMHHQIDRLFAQTFVHFLNRLEEYGILDNGISVWCNDMGNGFTHEYLNVPFISVGSGNGFLKTGQFIDFNGVTHNKLFNTYINAFGIRNANGGLIKNFGDPDVEGGVLDDLISS